MAFGSSVSESFSTASSEVDAVDDVADSNVPNGDATEPRARPRSNSSREVAWSNNRRIAKSILAGLYASSCAALGQSCVDVDDPMIAWTPATHKKWCGTRN